MADVRKSVGAMRGALTLIATALAIVAAASCDDPKLDRGGDCGYGGPRCRSVCDYWCDEWGCYPQCWDQCWHDCGGPPGIAPPPGDASTATDAASDAGTSTNGDASANGVLCSACVANDDCESGALCILRGGPPSPSASDASASDAGSAPTGNGFCGHACATGTDCPEGFTCTQLGSSKQCLPNTGSCP